jgi:hypothetical protein
MCTQRVTKRCRLSWLTNSSLLYESKCGGGGRIAGSQPMSTAVHNALGAQINFGDLPPYLTFACTCLLPVVWMGSCRSLSPLPLLEQVRNCMVSPGMFFPWIWHCFNCALSFDSEMQYENAEKKTRLRTFRILCTVNYHKDNPTCTAKAGPVRIEYNV